MNVTFYFIWMPLKTKYPRGSSLPLSPLPDAGCKGPHPLKMFNFKNYKKEIN